MIGQDQGSIPGAIGFSCAIVRGDITSAERAAVKCDLLQPAVEASVTGVSAYRPEKTIEASGPDAKWTSVVGLIAVDGRRGHR